MCKWSVRNLLRYVNLSVLILQKISAFTVLLQFLEVADSLENKSRNSNISDILCSRPIQTINYFIKNVLPYLVRQLKRNELNFKWLSKLQWFEISFRIWVFFKKKYNYISSHSNSQLLRGYSGTLIEMF